MLFVNKIDNQKYIGKMNATIIDSVRKGGDNMEKDMIRSLVAGMGIAGLVAGTTLAAPALAAESG